MYYSLSEMQNELKNRLKYPDIPLSRLTRWLNEGQNDLSRDIDCDHLYKQQTISTVASQKIYYVDYDFNRVVSAVNVNQDCEITQLSKSEIEDMDPNEDSGSPYAYYMEGISYVKGQPTTAAVVSFSSSDTSDTTQKIIIRGTVSGTDQYETLTLNGTTTVTGTKLFSELYSIRKNGDTDGIVTVVCDSTTVAVLGPNDVQKEYQKLHLYPTPDAVETIKLRGISKPRIMIDSTDAPDFPEPYHELVLIAAEVRGHFDLFHATLAEKIRDGVYAPRLAELAKQMGNKRYKKSPVIRSNTPYKWQPRLPQNIG